MTQRRKSTSRSNEGITITISIRAKNEKAAKRILEHPTLKGLVEVFEGKHTLGGQDVDNKHPYAHFSEEDFQGDVHLRSRAIKWLEVQYNRAQRDPERVIRIKNPWRISVDNCIFDLIASNLPELAAVYQMMAVKVLRTRGGLKARELTGNFGYRDFPTSEVRKYEESMGERISESIGKRRHEDILNAICAWEGETFASVNLD